ncbi:MAG: NAD(P)-dependent oxidoreductase, partial [Thermoleophilia bacterium]|nr:NAD(P)-dependent oxidoreductase [Thermoleophilia bacterium]
MAVDAGGDGGRPRVAVLGLGIMGGRIARRLLDAGLPVTVWNRDPAKAHEPGARGATIAPSPSAAVADSA